MSTITHAQYLEMLTRVGQSEIRQQDGDGVPLEAPLHKAIMDWCDSQWPRWRYVHARMDKRSTTGNGVADFVIFGPYPACFVVECKTRTGKLSEDQMCWIEEMRLLGWVVHVVRSFKEFLTLVTIKKP